MTNYAKSLIGPNFSSLNLPLIEDVNEDGLGNLTTYLADSANKTTYNTSYLPIKTRIYDNGAVAGKIESSFNKIDVSSPKFSADMNQYLINNKTDYAYHTLNNSSGDSLEKIMTSSGSEINFDPSPSSLSTSLNTFLGAAAGGLGFPLIGYGIRNYKIGEKTKGASMVAGGAALTGGFFGNFGYNAISYSNAVNNSGNLVAGLLGLKNMLYLGGSFLLGNGIYNFISPLVNGNQKTKTMKVSQMALGGIEATCGGYLIKGALSTLTSLTYEGFGLFSISTLGYSNLFASLVSPLLGLGLASLAAGVYAISWLRNKHKKHIKWSKP
ncbi:MAG: hypothetical protein PHN56_03335 [Candidatus Nanoarchaeia archaeon]|nr:hypothetical protein [Candidatus Nanoarchaeia archaeon]